MSKPGHPGIAIHTDAQPYGSAIFGMQASAPPEAFAAVVGLAGSVLTAADFGAVARRLELSVPARR